MADYQRFDPTALRMLHRVGGEKLIGKMRCLFMANAPARLQSVEDALATGRTAGGVNPAHSLKSSAGQLGAVELQQLCDKLEAACVAEEIEKARQILSAAREELPSASTWIANWSPD